jgi:hypothetical protein
VSKHVAYLCKKWIERANIDTADRLAIELAKIDATERRAWEALKKSDKPFEVEGGDRREEPPGPATGSGNGTPAVVKTRTSYRRESRVADPRYMEVILKCIERRCKILGLDAPTRAELSGPGGRPIAITHVEVVLTPEGSVETATGTARPGSAESIDAIDGIPNLPSLTGSAV